MNEYERNKNGRKWLLAVVIAILIATVYLVTAAVIIIKGN